MLKDRVSQLERMSNVFRDGIKNIQPNQCSCHQTVELIKQVQCGLQGFLCTYVVKSALFGFALVNELLNFFLDEPNQQQSNYCHALEQVSKFSRLESGNTSAKHDELR